jgi:hypothetical protein
MSDINTVLTGYTYPSDNLPPEKKGKNYILDYAKALYYNYINQSISLGFNERNQYSINRLFSMGLQDVNQYKQMLGLGDEDEQFVSIDFKPLDIGNKFAQVVKGNMQRQSYKVSARAINPLGLEERRAFENKLAFDILFKDKIEEIKRILNMQDQEGQEQQELPKTIEELQMYMQSDYKSNAEVMAELSFALVAYQNDWHVIKDKVIDDLIVCGITCVKDYIDSNGAVKLRVVDPENLITGWTERPDFKDCRHFGEIQYKTISELKQLDSFRSLTEEDWEKIANKFKGDWGNPVNYKSSTMNPNSKYYYDGARVPVLDFEFKTVNTYSYEKKTSSKGSISVKKVPGDYKPQQTIQGSKYERQVTRKAWEVWYSGKWIIDTDYMFDYGMVTNMKRHKTSLQDARSSFSCYAPSMYKMRVKSLMEKAIEPINMIHINWYRFQQCVAQARPKGGAIDINALLDVQAGDGGDTFTPLEIRDIFDKTGLLLYSSRDVAGRQTGSPWQDIENGMASDAQRYLNNINYGIELINQLTGINSAMDASNPNAEMGKGQTQLAIQSANNALNPLYMAYRNLLLMVADSAVLRVQDTITAGNNIEGYINAVGSSFVDFIKINKDITLYDFAIEIESTSDDEDIAILNSYIQTELAVRSQSGAGGITVEDAMEIRSVMKSNLKQASRLLSLKRKQREQEAHQRALEQQQQSQQMSAQASQVAEQAKQQTLQLEYQLKAELEKLKGELELQKEQIRAESLKMAYTIQAQGNLAKTGLQGEIDGHIELIKGANKNEALQASIADEQEKAVEQVSNK